MPGYYNYYDNPEYWKEKGVDRDLLGCLECNPQEAFKIEDIEKVLAVHEGENDEEDWIWIIQLHQDDSYVFLQGWCDYTGWDCQSNAISLVGATPLVALESGMSMVQEKWGRIDGQYRSYMPMYEHIMTQISKEEKAVTWRETMDKVFGLTKEK